MNNGYGEVWAYYSNFMVGDTGSKYKLTVSNYSNFSTAGDSLSYHNGAKFSTLNQNNSGSRFNPSKYSRGNFWYRWINCGTCY